MINNSADLVGKVLGTCLLERLVGRGGMSVVYLAQQNRPLRHVAVKILLPDVPMGSKLHHQFLIRFRHEADIIARLEHVNIIPIFECGEEDGLAYLIMPYLSGGSLSHLLAHRGALSLQEAIIFMEQATAALNYAHAHGVIHRDLKPGNFLLSGEGRLVLADFGIARIIQDCSRTNGSTLTSPGLMLGTPDYMSPEMARGEPIDARSDIYELGVVLFHMLSGDVPFKGSTPYSILLQHMQEPLPFLHTINPAIPPAVDAVIQKATAKRREDRFAFAGEMVSALRLAITRPLYPFESVSASASTVYSAQPSLPTYHATIAAQDFSPKNGAGKKYSPGSQTPVIKPAYLGKTGSMLIGLILVAIAALIMSGIFFVYAQPTHNQGITQKPMVTATDHAKATVQQFYDAIDRWDYASAYKVFSGDYCNMVNDYAHTLHDKVTIGDVTALSNSTYSVAITLHATDILPSGTFMSIYMGDQIVRQESDGTWKIIGGGNINLTDRNPISVATPLVASEAPPNQQAQAVIQQFYNDINVRNYPDAYNLWGSAFQNSTKYCSFIQGYVHTQHDDITFNGITPSANGTVLIETTISAIEDGRTAPRLYWDTNIVGENEYHLWKILSGKQTLV